MASDDETVYAHSLAGHEVIVYQQSGATAPRRAWMEEPRFGVVVGPASKGLLVINVHVPNPATPVVQVEVPETPGEVGTSGLSWQPAATTRRRPGQ